MSSRALKKMDGRPKKIIRIKNQSFEALLDTGAGISAMNEEVMHKLGSIKLTNSYVRVQGAFGNGGNCVGSIEVTIKVEEDRLDNVKFYVFKNIKPNVILGIDVLKRLGLELCKIAVLQSGFIKDTKIPNDVHYKAVIGKHTIDEYLKKIIKQNLDVFMKNKFDMGCTNVLEHKIETNSRPITQNPRRQPIHLEEKLEELILKLEVNGIILWFYHKRRMVTLGCA